MFMRLGLLIAAAVFATLLHGTPVFAKVEPKLVGDGHERDWKWPAMQADICFENPGSEWSIEKEWVRDAIQDSWEHYSDIELTFHMATHCTDVAEALCKNIPKDQTCEPQLIRIRLESHVSTVGENSYSYIGKSVFGKENGVFINMLGCIGIKSCIQSTTRHEFGHALGFHHEHRRSDAEKKCADAHQPKEGDSALTDEKFLTKDYDPDSIMNYCRGILAAPTLSKEDIRGLQSVYGDGGHPIDEQPKFAEAKYVGKFLNCGDRYAANDTYEKAFLHALTDQCYSCPKGKSRTVNPDVVAKTACESGAFFQGAAPAVLRGRPGCPEKREPGYGRGFQHGLSGNCYACPEDYDRTLWPKIGSLAGFEKACALRNRPGD